MDFPQAIGLLPLSGTASADQLSDRGFCQTELADKSMIVEFEDSAMFLRLS